MTLGRGREEDLGQCCCRSQWWREAQVRARRQQLVVGLCVGLVLGFSLQEGGRRVREGHGDVRQDGLRRLFSRRGGTSEIISCDVQGSFPSQLELDGASSNNGDRTAMLGWGSWASKGKQTSTCICTYLSLMSFKLECSPYITDSGQHHVISYVYMCVHVCICMCMACIMSS